jgi:hypothetical protein
MALANNNRLEISILPLLQSDDCHWPYLYHVIVRHIIATSMFPFFRPKYQSITVLTPSMTL